MCDCEGAFTKGGRGFFIPTGSTTTFAFFKSILASDDDFGRKCFGIFFAPEVEGAEADEIDGMETVEVFLMSSGFLDSL